KEIAEIIDDNKISQDVVVENVQNAFSQEDGEPQSVNEAEHSLETRSTRDETINERTVSQVSEVSIDKTQRIKSAETIEVCPATEFVKSEHENEEIEALPKTEPCVSATRTKVPSSPAHGVGVNESNGKQRRSALLLNKKSDAGASDVDHHLAFGIQMVRHGRPPRNARKFTDQGSDVKQRDPHDIEIERLQQRIRDLEIQHEHPDEDTLSSPSNWDKKENPFGGRRQHLRGMNRDDPLRNLGIKIEIPKFVGKAHPDDFIDRLSTVERIFDIRDILEKLKVKLVAIKLRKSAS
ncbi:hypothetical protein Tco_1297424, partial [Tanacetum coccineum]